MIRVRNEGEFLVPSVLSISHLADEIVIIDNLSNDNTPELIAGLTRELGAKVHAYKYPYEVARIGEDYHALQRENPNSPGLLHHYYNWCLGKCRMPFIMKWDADMIALDEFAGTLEDFKKGAYLQCSFGGHNLSYDRQHVLTWAALIEPRIYPRFFTSFSYGAVDGCELLKRWVAPEWDLLIQKPLYMHMKYCKTDPASNISPEFNKRLETKIEIAGPVPVRAAESVSRWLSLPLETKNGR